MTLTIGRETGARDMQVLAAEGSTPVCADASETTALEAVFVDANSGGARITEGYGLNGQ